MIGFSIADDCIISICRRNQNMKEEKHIPLSTAQTIKPGPALVGHFHKTMIPNMLPVDLFYPMHGMAAIKANSLKPTERQRPYFYYTDPVHPHRLPLTPSRP
jgi:hypothetical protein